jgi:bifunctional non-homologous end joining protein LigD
MLASTVDVSLANAEFVYEPKYDGIRTIALVTPGHPAPEVRLYSRLGNDKTSQFPSIARALGRFALKLRQPTVIDGEIVALDPRGRPIGFQNLQGRLHRKSVGAAEDTPSAFIAFDLLRDGPHDLRHMTLVARRAALERVFGKAGSPLLRLSKQVAHDGRELYREAIAEGWEGLIAKRASSKYLSGKRTTDWIKLKLIREQEFVVGGWTEPRGTRSNLGALLLGVYDEDARLHYVAHVGSGFNEAELDRLMRALKPLETSRCPFDEPPPGTNETPHWVKPRLVAQVKFTEWTDEGRLRHPTYLGLRDDVKPKSVRREEGPQYSPRAMQRLEGAAPRPGDADAGGARSARGGTRSRSASGPAEGRSLRSRGGGKTVVGPNFSSANRRAGSSGAGKGKGGEHGTTPPLLPKDLQLVVDQLTDLEKRRKKGPIVLPDGESLDVGNLEKVFWPDGPHTKGDLLRYYVRVSPYILPVVADRPLVMKRFPNGVGSDAFYQHRAPEKIPAGIRSISLPDDDVPSRLVGGSLKTLLYLAQLAAISMDPWFSRVDSLQMVDHVALDLDPMPGTSFDTVLDVARWVHDELERVGAVGFPKTSGADGLHVYVPMPKNTPYEAGRIWAQIVATMVATKHPKVATVERTVSKRGAKVYVDYLQNIEGKTLACAYSARASEYAGASAPLTWDEVHRGVDRRDFTIATLPARLKEVGDLWRLLFKAKPPDLRHVTKHLR